MGHFGQALTIRLIIWRSLSRDNMVRVFRNFVRNIRFIFLLFKSIIWEVVPKLTVIDRWAQLDIFRLFMYLAYFIFRNLWCIHIILLHITHYKVNFFMRLRSECLMNNVFNTFYLIPGATHVFFLPRLPFFLVDGSLSILNEALIRKLSFHVAHDHGHFLLVNSAYFGGRPLINNLIYPTVRCHLSQLILIMLRKSKCHDK